MGSVSDTCTRSPQQGRHRAAFTLVEVAVVCAAVAIAAALAVAAVSGALNSARTGGSLQRIFDDVARQRAALVLASIGPMGCLQISLAVTPGPPSRSLIDYDLRSNCTDAGTSVSHVTSADLGIYLDLSMPVCFDAQARPCSCTSPAALMPDIVMPVRFEGAAASAGDLIWRADSHLGATFSVEAGGDAFAVAHINDIGRAVTPDPTPGFSPPAADAVSTAGLLQ